MSTFCLWPWVLIKRSTLQLLFTSQEEKKKHDAGTVETVTNLELHCIRTHNTANKWYNHKRKTDIHMEMENLSLKKPIDTTQQPIHIKARPDQAEHAAVCHWGIVLFLCNTPMIKEFNTASRLMTPLGCRGTQERRSQGLWRILAEMGIGSKIHKFIHQKAVFLCHGSVHACECVQVVKSEQWWRGEKMWAKTIQYSESDGISLLRAIKHQANDNSY